jgi:urea transport system permease protein
MLVNLGKTYFSESAPDLWLFLMAALFIGVTMAFPNGLAGLVEEKLKPWYAGRRAALAAASAAARRAAVSGGSRAASDTEPTTAGEGGTPSGTQHGTPHIATMSPALGKGLSGQNV